MFRLVLSGYTHKAEMSNETARSAEAEGMKPEKYSAIFLNWCIGYPTEDDLVRFLKKAKKNLIESYVDTKSGKSY